ncbi:MAG: zinc-binding dehydrogenase, partial [Bacteroidales bacterium]|nr:zinc-binding dehydrogenase [Bacteroidales bacterium]
IKKEIKYDIILDIGNVINPKRVKSLLNPGGKYIFTKLSFSSIIYLINIKAYKITKTRPDKQTLLYLSKLIRKKKLKVHKDKIFDMDKISHAQKYFEHENGKGKIIIRMNRVMRHKFE